jgi:hypothetical protein
MHIPVKAGRLATGSYLENSPIDGNVFRRSKQGRLTPATVGGLKMPDNRMNTVYGNPLSDQYDVSTQVEVAARTSVGRFHVGQNKVSVLHSPTGNVPLIQPHEKGSTLRRKIVPVDKRQFGAGVDNEADTAFHRNPEAVHARPTPVSAVAGEKTAAKSFHSNSNLWIDPNNSFYKGVTTPGTGRTGLGRWGTTKTGVV